MRSVHPVPLALLTAGLVALLLAGCASIISGKSQEVRVHSNPSAARLAITQVDKDGTHMTVWEGVTPANVNLRRKGRYAMRLDLEGYQPVEMDMHRGTNGWVFGNLLLGGLIGIAIDYSTGAARKVLPGEVVVDLVAVTSVGPGGERAPFALLRLVDGDGLHGSAFVPLTPIR